MPAVSTALHCAIVSASLAVHLAGHAQAAPPLRMHVYPVPGLFDVLEDGRITGPGGALLTKIGLASDVKFEAVSLPIARGVSTVLVEPQSCMLGMTRTPEREARFQWVGIVSRADYVVYGRADSPTLRPELTALRGKAVVVVRKTAAADQLDDEGVAAQEVSSTLSALRMLQVRRVDYWYSHQLVAESAASAAGGGAIKPMFSTARTDGYVACHLDVPAATIDKLRRGLQRLRRSGDLAAFGLR